MLTLNPSHRLALDIKGQTIRPFTPLFTAKPTQQLPQAQAARVLPRPVLQPYPLAA